MKASSKFHFASGWSSAFPKPLNLALIRTDEYVQTRVSAKKKCNQPVWLLAARLATHSSCTAESPLPNIIGLGTRPKSDRRGRGTAWAGHSVAKLVDASSPPPTLRVDRIVQPRDLHVQQTWPLLFDSSPNPHLLWVPLCIDILVCFLSCLGLPLCSESLSPHNLGCFCLCWGYQWLCRGRLKV